MFQSKQMHGSRLLAATLLLWSVASCSDNDTGTTPSGQTAAGSSAGGTSATGGTTAAGGTSGAGGTKATAGTAGHANAGTNAGTGGYGGAFLNVAGAATIGVGAADASLVEGTGANCQSYTPPANGMCGGWFCGVNQDTLAQAVDPSAKCGNAQILCSNVVPTAVGKCARMIKSQNVTATNAQLMPLIQDCVFQDPNIQMNVTPDCLDCVITGAECAADNCLTQCLAGDSPQCDSCRKAANCDQQVFMCGGVPSPI